MTGLMDIPFYSIDSIGMPIISCLLGEQKLCWGNELGASHGYSGCESVSTDHGGSEEAVLLVKETRITERNYLCFIGTRGKLTAVVKLRLTNQL